MAALFGWLCIAAGIVTLVAYFRMAGVAAAAGDYAAYPSVWVVIAAGALLTIGLGLFVL